MKPPRAAKPKPTRAGDRKKALGRNGLERRVIAARPHATLERRTLRVCVVATLFAGMVFLLTEGEQALRIELGQPAKRDYVARVGFQCEDREVALYQRNLAVRQQPSCYRLQGQDLQRQRDSITAIFKRIQWDSDVGATADELAKREVNLLEPERFRREVLDLGDKLPELIAHYFEVVGRWGILSREQYRDELTHGREEIAVIRGPAAARVRVKLDRVMTPGAAGRELVEARIAATFPNQSDIFRSNFLAIVEQTLGPSLKFDPEATEQAKQEAFERVEPPIMHVKPDDVLLRRQAAARPHHVYQIAEERRAFDREVRWSYYRLRTMAAVAVPLAVLFWLGGVYLSRFQSELLESNRRLGRLALLCLLVLTVAHVLVRVGLPAVLTPLALASIIVSMGHGERLGVLVSIALAAAVAAMQDGAMDVALVLGLGGIAAALNSTKIDRRTSLIKIGLITGAVQFVLVWALDLLALDMRETVSFERVESVVAHSLWALGNGVAVGLLVSSTLPVIEYLFNITTDITLLELSDLNQPALQDLMLSAPGTYHHSLMVGMLSEDAAKTVNANSLLARVGSYYHDIGKVLKPDYFVENAARGVSQHTDLAPQMSALVITAHTKDGATLAVDYGLPRRIIDIVLQHHGTTRVEYFYREALKENGAENVEEDLFRYRGPKPQTKEAAIVLCADSVESASRVLSEPNPSRIEGLVDEIVDHKLRDGQLDECGLTFRELTMICKSLVRGMTATFHSRIQYPKPPDES